MCASMGNFEQNTGGFLNSESNVPTDGLLSAGAAVNVGQGLILDDRRATLRKAQIYEQATAIERVNFLNELHLQATATYWKWAAAYENKRVLSEGVDLAKVRFQESSEVLSWVIRRQSIPLKHCLNY